VAHFTDSSAAKAIPDAPDFPEMMAPQWSQIQKRVALFRQQAPTPEGTWEFEIGLFKDLQEIGRRMLEHEWNRIEPEALTDCPVRLRLAGEEYKRRPKSRNTIATLFGPILVNRYLYEPLERGEKSIFPLEMQLGIEAGLATPALAERIGLQAAGHTQQQVRDWLARDHGIGWSNKTLRKLLASLRSGLTAFRQTMQVAKILKWLNEAWRSKGPHQPVLAVGRDGIMVPLRAGYQEAATATVSVFDRRGRRLGTVYLGRMPEAGQTTLTDQLTVLVTDVLKCWQKPLPRLAYLTDGGHHPRDYYGNVLRRMANPQRPGQLLKWQWIVDFWHACGYLAKLKEALFGDAKAGWAWFKKMRHWLRHRNRGVTQVLRSAVQRWNQLKRPSRQRTNLFDEGYRYLRKHTPWLAYSHYRRQGLPIGSGVTEAACKTVFTQRLKQSGMTWTVAGGQVIVDLRVLVLSGVWPETHRAYLRSRSQPEMIQTRSYPIRQREILKIAA
jgi:hypothetical protein